MADNMARAAASASSPSSNSFDVTLRGGFKRRI
jgi:hypothetical protein